FRLLDPAWRLVALPHPSPVPERALARRPPVRALRSCRPLHEIAVHHLTRFAVLQAMERGVPIIYGCFYTYDEAAHAFGPDDEKTLDTLRHIDSTIGRVAARRAGAVEYDLVVLSDHGQVECTPFNAGDGK